MPMLPAMSAAGLLKAFVIMFNTFGVLDAASTTYQLLYAMGDAVFYFMPIFLARTAAQKFKCNDWTAMAIAAFLCYPTLTTLFNGTDPVDLFGLPVTLISYTSSVLPIIVAVWVQSWVERALNKVTPDMLKGLIVPLFTVFVACVATIFVVGPVTDIIGKLIASALISLLNTVPLVAGFLIGALWPCLIIFGMHWAFIPVIMSNIGTLGYDVILPITVGTNFAVGAAALAVFLKTKDTGLKEIAAASSVSALLAGITEPAIYGVVLKYKRPFADHGPVLRRLRRHCCDGRPASGGSHDHVRSHHSRDRRHGWLARCHRACSCCCDYVCRDACLWLQRQNAARG